MKAVIHIGTGKTGTTTIQRFLAKNRDALKKQQIFIPANEYDGISTTQNGLAGNSIELAAAAILPETWRTPRGLWFAPMLKEGFTRADQDRLWEKYSSGIQSNCHKDDLVIFSCEMLTHFSENEIQRVMELMVPLFDDVNVILYLRRQPEMLVSLYQTMIGNNDRIYDNVPPDIDACLSAPEEYSFLAYRKYVERWSVLGKDKLKIRIFDKQEFCNNDLLSDFANTVGFDMKGLERVENEFASIDSAHVEFIRLFNMHVPEFLTPSEFSDYQSMVRQIRSNAEKNKKAYHLTRSEAQQILDQFREGNDWIARKYLGREKLFSEDVSMYPEEVESPHGLTLEKCIEIATHLWKQNGLTLEKCAEITAHLWKEKCGVIHQLQQENQNLRQDVQNLQLENQKQASGDTDNLSHLLNQISIYWHYYRCKWLAKFTFGKKRKHYKAKRDMLHEKVRRIRKISKIK